MKRKILIAVASILLLAGAAARAQERAPTPAPARPDDQSQPKDDDQDLFPSVVLEIEDLSVEKIEAGLPADEPLMSFERQTPLPGPGEIRIEEPAVESLLPGENGAAKSGDKSFFTEVLFGAGLQNNLLGAVTLYRLGLSPVINLNVGYENADGFAYRQVGLGYGERRDEFGGGIKLAGDALSFEAEGGFKETERGLQQQAAYFSALNQFSHLSLAFSAKAPELFTFSASARADLTGFSVTGSAAPPYPVSYPPTEYLVGGGLRGDLAWPAVSAGLGLEYRFRNIPGADNAFLANRFRADLSAGWDISPYLRAEGKVGVFTSTAIPYLIPWQARVRWSIFDWLGLSAGGGYRIEEQNLAGTLAAFPYADFPAALPDNHGWFTNAGVQVSFANLLLLTVDGTYAENASDARLGATPDAATGLFPVLYGTEVPTFSLDCRLKLPLTNWLTLSGSNRLVLPLAPGNVPVVAIGAEAAAEEVGGAFGATLALKFQTDVLGQWEFPYLDATAYVRIIDNMKLAVEALDLLQPLLGGPRYSPYPYLAPGIRARFKISISL
jgi:hypothetical protein